MAARFGTFVKKMTEKKRIELTGVDLFAGAGGFSLAAKKSGIKIRAAIEINKHAASTYTRNFIKGRRKPPVLFTDDIEKISFSKLMQEAKLVAGACDVLLGGPPCQGFSTHRINGSGIDDPRNNLLLKYFEFVRALQPKVFVVENVPGLLWSRHEKFLQKFISEATNAGYSVRSPVVLNSKDYGVPQNRKRVFILGIRSDIALDIVWPPLKTHFDPNSDEVNNKKLPAWLPAKGVFDMPIAPDDINAVHMNHSAAMINVFERTPRNGGSRAESGRVLRCHSTHDGHTDVYGRIDPTKPSPTMTTACINPSKGRFVHPTLNHGITARHAARFQTFPDDFIFDGGIIASGVQIGNAVPVKLGQAVLDSVSAALHKIISANDGAA